MKPWSVGASRLVLQDRWISLRADDCVTASGRRVEPYYVLEYPDFAHVFATTCDDCVVLVRQYRHALGAVSLELPGGVVDPADADPGAAGMRELLEETGFAGPSWRVSASLSADPAKFANRTHLVTAQGVERVSAPKLDPGEDIEVVLTPMSELMTLIGSRRIVNACHVGLLMLALHDTGRIAPAVEG